MTIPQILNQAIRKRAAEMWLEDRPEWSLVELDEAAPLFRDQYREMATRELETAARAGAR